MFLPKELYFPFKGTGSNRRIKFIKRIHCKLRKEEKLINKHNAQHWKTLFQMATLLLAFSLLSATYEHGAPEQSLAFQALAFSPYTCTATPSHQLLRTNPSRHWWKFWVRKWAPFEPPWEAKRAISQPVLASAHLAGAAPGGENTGCLFWAWSASTSLLENSPLLSLPPLLIQDWRKSLD